MLDNRNWHASTAGFSLIELIVTVGIMILLVGGGIAGFISYTERQQVFTSTKSVQQFIRTAQSKARVRETPAACDTTNPNDRLQGYRIKFINSTTMEIRPLCGADNQVGTVSAAPTVIEEAAIANMTLTNVSLTGTYPAYIDFYTLHRDQYPVSNHTLHLQGYSTDYCFDVETGGAINDVVSC